MGKSASVGVPLEGSSRVPVLWLVDPSAAEKKAQPNVMALFRGRSEYGPTCDQSTSYVSPVNLMGGRAGFKALPIVEA